MKTHVRPISTQHGAATILTAIILLVGITLVAITATKTVLTETQVTANYHRSAQAVASANYAMDYAVRAFESGLFVDSTQTLPLTAGYTATLATAPPNLSIGGVDLPAVAIEFNPFGCGGTGSNWRRGQIIATGYSDDGIASRTITQCVGPMADFTRGGPKQPLLAQGNVALTGNARIINRYTNTTIWSGGDVTIGSSSAMETYIKDPDVSTALTQDELIASDDSNTIVVSNRNLGNGLDIIDNDPTLGTLVGIDFFKNFFAVQSRDQLRQLAIAAGQCYQSAAICDTATDLPISNVVNKSGLIWVEGNASLSGAGNQIGTPAKPAIMIVNGNFQLNGGTIYGVLYVVGKYDVAGNPTVFGANLVEGTNVATGAPASPPIVTGNGTLDLIFWANILGSATEPLPGIDGLVNNSWRDW